VKKTGFRDLEQTSASARDHISWLRQLAPVLLVAMAIRMVVVFFTYRSLPDADKFYESFGWEMGWIARALASGHGFSSPYFPWSGPTAIEPPLYPALLSLVFRLFGIYSLTSAFVILTINSILSTLTCIPVYFSAQYSLGNRAARIAAWVWALYPFAIYFSAGRVWEYALTGLLFTTCFCIAQRIGQSAKPLAQSCLSWIGFGALYGIAAYSNASILSTLPFLLGFALYQAHKAGRRWMLNGALTVLTFAAVLAPWTIRNYKTFGILVPMRDNLWLELYADDFGNAPNDHTSPPTCVNRPYPASNATELKKYLAMGEIAYLKEKHDLSIADLRNHPHVAFLVTKTLRRVVYYWTGFWSFSAQELRDQPFTPENVFYVSSVTLFMILGIVSLWRTNRTAVIPYLLLLGVFPITYYLTHPMMDYREPIEPAVIVLGTAGALSLRSNRARAEAGRARAAAGRARAAELASDLKLADAKSVSNLGKSTRRKFTNHVTS
jgi:4-amino-4-deoxy-L-arabinose transferase-like glycosyltransferase